MLKNWINISKNKLVLPFYHLVSDSIPNYVKHLYQPKTIQQFKKELEVFLNYYQSISLDELILNNKTSKPYKKPSFHLTFDDGLANFYHIIAPILLEKKITATVFLNTDFVDNKDLFYRYKASLLIRHYQNSNKEIKAIFHSFFKEPKSIKEKLLSINFQEKEKLDVLANKVGCNFKKFLQTEKPYLSLVQIKELTKQGFTFGAHSCNHPKYQELELKEQIKQTKDSLLWLKNNIPNAKPVFSFPFYDMDISNQFFKEMKDDLILSFGTSGFKKDVNKNHLQRLDMEKSPKDTKAFLNKEYLKLGIKKALNKNKIKRN